MAEYIRKNNVLETYFFDDERITETYEGEVVKKFKYKTNNIIIDVSNENGFVSHIVKIYRNDKLYKELSYDANNILLGYSVYDHDSWEYKTYDKFDNLIEKGNMIRIGK